GNSRMSTFVIRSTNGTMTCMPGWRTALNSPSRFTTPTLPCWTILSTRLANTTRAKTTTTTTMTRTTTEPVEMLAIIGLTSSRPDQAGLSPPPRSRARPVDDEQAALDVSHHDVGAGVDRLVGVQGDGQPVLAAGADPAGSVATLNGPGDHGGVADHPLDTVQHQRPPSSGLLPGPGPPPQTWPCRRGPTADYTADG